MANTHAYTCMPGLDDGRPIFAIAACEGVLNFPGETRRVYFRVQAHLLRYTLLDVDCTLPRPVSARPETRTAVSL